MSDPLGRGLGSTGGAAWLTASSGAVVFDNGVLDIFYSLGWVGGALFLWAVIWTADRSRRAARAQRDGPSTAAFAVVVALVGLLASGNGLTGIGGVFFWGLAGLLQGGVGYAAAVAGQRSAAITS
jgi:uncharacterized membrane protein